jgi:hypothetical protein
VIVTLSQILCCAAVSGVRASLDHADVGSDGGHQHAPRCAGALERHRQVAIAVAPGSAIAQPAGLALADPIVQSSPAKPE